MEFPSHPPGAPKDTSRAGIWIAIGMVGLVMLVLVGAVMLFVGVRRVSENWRSQMANSTCMSTTQFLGSAMQMYTADYDGKYPPADQWADGLLQQMGYPGVLQCAAMERPANWPGTDFAFNSILDQKVAKDLADQSLMPLLFETDIALADDGSRNVSNPLESFVARHDDGGTVLYADGHVTRETAAPDPKAGLTAAEDEAVED